MVHIYGHKWISSHGESALDGGQLSDTAKTWGSALRDITGEQLAEGLRRCVDSSESWPPSLPEFKKMCVGREDGFKLGYTPQYYRRETRPENLLESTPDKGARKKAAEKGIAAMREELK